MNERQDSIVEVAGMLHTEIKQANIALDDHPRIIDCGEVTGFRDELENITRDRDVVIQMLERLRYRVHRFKARLEKYRAEQKGQEA